jgi:hypothetical protein
MQGELSACLPNGYFHPGMCSIKRLQLEALVPNSAYMVDKLPSPGPADNPIVPSEW